MNLQNIRNRGDNLSQLNVVEMFYKFGLNLFDLGAFPVCRELIAFLTFSSINGLWRVAQSVSESDGRLHLPKENCVYFLKVRYILRYIVSHNWSGIV